MWKIAFITEEQLVEHVSTTIRKYGEKLDSYNLKKFNSNIIDPIKLIFDKTVYNLTWDEIIKNEISRQRDKSNNNDIGYFHQKIFSYISGCIVPNIGWDVIYTNPNGIQLPDGDNVHKIYVEMKNKHNTMNSASSSKTYIKMQNQLLNDDDCSCFLVEAIAKKSQNIKWETTIDGRKVNHKLIRRLSLDQFYALVTGEQDAFFQLCTVLPDIIRKVVENNDDIIIPKDTVLDELKNIAKSQKTESDDLAIALSVYMLGFSTYIGFNKV